MIFKEKTKQMSININQKSAYFTSSGPPKHHVYLILDHLLSQFP